MMNKKIKELAVQAGVISSKHDLTSKEEEFVELIIRECSKVAMDNLDCPASAIETHFGVE